MGLSTRTNPPRGLAPRVLDNPVLAAAVGSAPYRSRLVLQGSENTPALVELEGAAGAVDEHGDGLTGRGALQRGPAVAPPPTPCVARSTRLTVQFDSYSRSAKS